MVKHLPRFQFPISLNSTASSSPGIPPNSSHLHPPLIALIKISLFFPLAMFSLSVYMVFSDSRVPFALRTIEKALNLCSHVFFVSSFVVPRCLLYFTEPKVTILGLLNLLSNRVFLAVAPICSSWDWENLFWALKDFEFLIGIWKFLKIYWYAFSVFYILMFYLLKGN